MVTHGIKTYFQSHPDAEVLTTLEESSKFLKQCVRWSRSNWRSNLRSLFIDRAVWWRHPWSTYAVFLTTISQLALLTDTCLIWLCHTMTMSNPTLHTWWLGVLLIWMIFTKFIKLSGHYRRRPLDCLLFPVSALFGYVHCFIKMYALFSLHEVQVIFFSFSGRLLIFHRTRGEIARLSVCPNQRQSPKVISNCMAPIFVCLGALPWITCILVLT
ncbi:polysaccharide synthase Cps1 [Histoplasma ohiense]|nr:polysaccharide synthase Cps1 [Histoplasma ohiense (nom. inval.)]